MSWLGAGKAAAAQGAAARLAQGEAHDSPQRHGRRLLQFVSRDEVEIVGDAADCGGHAQKFPGYRSKGNVDTFQHHARRGLSHHSATAPRPILKIRIQSSLLGSMSVHVATGLPTGTHSNETHARGVNVRYGTVMHGVNSHACAVSRVRCGRFSHPPPNERL